MTITLPNVKYFDTVDAFDSMNLPTLNVLITTHNRTTVAINSIISLITNISYSGKINWIVCDDRSKPFHIDAILDTFNKKNIHNVKVFETDATRYGLGASLNNGLKEAFKTSPVVLTTEDDWLLKKKLNFNSYVQTLLLNRNVAGIRLAATTTGHDICDSNISGFYKFKKDNTRNYIFNNQVMLRHKRIFDEIGYMKENCSSDEQEKDIVDRFNVHTDFGEKFLVLYPKVLDTTPKPYGDKKFFDHIGRSTHGTDRYICDQYKKLNDGNADRILRETYARKKFVSNKKLPPLSVVITTHNRTKLAKETLKSLIKNLKYSGEIYYIVCDDRSIPGHIIQLENVFVENGIDSKNVIIKCTNESRFGLGASLNNGLKEAFKISPVVLTTEDDWILQFPLKLDGYVKEIYVRENVAGIRLAALLRHMNDLEKFSADFYKITNKSGKKFIFNNQVMLRHKRIFDVIGYYEENTKVIQTTEDIMSDKFNKLTNGGKSNNFVVLWPRSLPLNVMNNKKLPFVHAGISTSGHDYAVDKRFICLNTSEMKLKYYTKVKNFGDVVNPDIIKFLCGAKMDSCPLESVGQTGLMAIGSIIQYAGPLDTIWGSGCITDKIKPKNISSTTKIRLLRGPLTEQFLQKFGLSCPGKFCDPGVLIPLLCDIDKMRSETEKKYKYGFVLHYADLKIKKMNQITSNPDCLVISMQEDRETVIRKMLSCETILSSSLHGIVVAETLGIPAAWVLVSDNVVGDGFKFYDYYLGSGRQKEEVFPIDWRKKIIFGTEQFAKKPTYDVRALLDTFPLEISKDKYDKIINWFSNEKLI